ncbi:MAG: sulfatase-like hydrolase/transferase [Acidobacteriaceae bacterium]
MKARTLLQASGVSAFALFRLYGPAIAHPSDLRMHTSAPLTNFALSLIVNIVLTAIVLAFLANWIARFDRACRLQLFLPGFVAYLLVKVVYLSFSAAMRPAIGITIFAGISILTIILRYRSPSGEQSVLRLTGAIMAGMGIFSVLAMVQLARIAAAPTAPSSFDNLRATTISPVDHPRVIWILFDELSYQQTFGDRYPGLRLPNFDELRESSTVFTDVQPVEKFTELAIPSILLGYSVRRVHYTFGNQLLVASGTKAPFHSFNPATTPFAAARLHGLTTGLVGWFNPYCGILGPYLDRCYWTGTDEDLIPPQFSMRDGFWKDLINPWKHSVADLMRSHRGTHLAARRENTYQDLMRQADRILQQPNLDFVFIHLPIPHPPGLYDRQTQQFDDSGNRSYIDNLALADKSLGQMLTPLKRSPRWTNTSVIVCGDHSWRIWLWSPMPSWTAEDEAASHGRTLDPRPVLMVHQAGQSTSETVATPFPLLRVHTILDNLVKGKQPAFATTSR